jgi:hypothetical protein
VLAWLNRRGVLSTINPWFRNWFGFNRDCCNWSPKYKHSLMDSMYPFPVVGSVQHVKAVPMGMFANFPSSGERTLHSTYMSNCFQTESYCHIHGCLRVCPFRNGTHGSTLTGGLGPGDVSSLGFNIVPVHVPSSWLSVIDDEAFWCFMGWGCLGHYPVGRLPAVATNHSWSQTLIHNHWQTASYGSCHMTNDLFWADPCSNDGGFLASH